MSAFGDDKRHEVTFEVRGPKTRRQVKAYMKRIRTLLRGLPGNIASQSVSAKGKRKSRKRKPKKRRRRNS